MFHADACATMEDEAEEYEEYAVEEGEEKE